MESTNQTRHSYLETVLSPLAPPNTLPLNDSVQVPHSTGEKELPLGQPRYRTFEMDQEKHQFPVISHSSSNGMFCIDCNNCGRSIANAHYHCSICENGDYDLCLQCVGAGSSCRGEGHWLIKRTVKDGVVTNSTTETIAPRDQSALEFNPVLPTQIQREVITKPVVHVPESVPELAPESIQESIQESIPESIQESVPEPVAPSACLDAAIQGDDKPMCNGCCRGKFSLSHFPFSLLFADNAQKPMKAIWSAAMSARTMIFAFAVSSETSMDTTLATPSTLDLTGTSA